MGHIEHAKTTFLLFTTLYLVVNWRAMTLTLVLVFVSRVVAMCQRSLKRNWQWIAVAFCRTTSAKWKPRCCMLRSSHLQLLSWYPPGVVPNCYWLLLVVGDLPPNPGPVRYPCTECGKPVRSNQQGIFCDRCEMWTNAKCCGMSKEAYERLSRSGLFACDAQCLDCLLLILAWTAR